MSIFFEFVLMNKRVAVSPLLVTSRPLAAYSNFWAGMNEQVCQI